MAIYRPLLFAGRPPTDPEIAGILTPMWLGQDNWLRTEGKDGLEALDLQMVRFHPANPG